MTLYEYNTCSRQEQLSLLATHAAQVAERQEGGVSYVLFQLDGFYIEKKSAAGQIDDLTTWANTTAPAMQPYLETMNVEGLL